MNGPRNQFLACSTFPQNQNIGWRVGHFLNRREYFGHLPTGTNHAAKMIERAAVDGDASRQGERLRHFRQEGSGRFERFGERGKLLRANPENIKNPDLNSSLAERSDHGLGLYFIRQWMDAVDFEFKPGSNTLTMSKFKENQT